MSIHPKAAIKRSRTMATANPPATLLKFLPTISFSWEKTGILNSDTLPGLFVDKDLLDRVGSAPEGAVLDPSIDPAHDIFRQRQTYDFSHFYLQWIRGGDRI
jgi:hypothetical protein